MRVLARFALVIAMSACNDTDVQHEIQALGETGYASYTATRHPIVLIHGLLGFDDLFGAVAYFHRIPDALEAGGAEVFVVTASSAQRVEVRGSQLIPQLEAIIEETGADKLNLIGHSAGALDARYVAAHRPDLVASVTSIGTPHKGSPLADLLLSTPVVGELGTDLLQVAADLFTLLSGSEHPNDARAALESLSTAGAAAFNAAHPAAVPTTACGDGEPIVDGIHYYSWGGTGTLTNLFDPGDPFLLATSLVIPGASDGLVPRCSTHLGDVIRDDYWQNHLDQVNQLFGIVGLGGPAPASQYRQHANRLKLAGL